MMRAFLGLGANVGNRRENLRTGLRLLAERCDVVAVSSLYRSIAVVPDGADAGPDFLNAACEIETDLTASELLAFVKSIERAMGRRRSEHWAPRPLDIDILLLGDELIETPDLVVPHPRIGERNFVLVPLAEIAGDVVHPREHRTIGELVEAVDYDGLEHLEGPEWSPSG